jgi:hypothetical protein
MESEVRQGETVSWRIRSQGSAPIRGSAARARWRVGHPQMFCISAASRCARPLTHGFTGHVARPSRSILLGAALLVRFAQGARGAFTCAITALGEF